METFLVHILQRQTDGIFQSAVSLEKKESRMDGYIDGKQAGREEIAKPGSKYNPL